MQSFYHPGQLQKTQRDVTRPQRKWKTTTQSHNVAAKRHNEMWREHAETQTSIPVYSRLQQKVVEAAQEAQRPAGYVKSNFLKPLFGQKRLSEWYHTLKLPSNRHWAAARGDKSALPQLGRAGTNEMKT